MLGLVLLALIFLPMFLVYYWLYMGIKKELDKIETLTALAFQRLRGYEKH